MPDKPNGFYAGSVFCVPAGPQNAEAFAYLPGSPRLDHDDGEPRITFMTTPDGGFVACETVWQPTDADLAAAEEALRASHPELTMLDLHIVDLADAEATLTITPTQGEAATFGPLASSGSPSYRVVFSESLEPAQAEAVAAALRGQPGRMTVAYRAALDLQETAAAEIAGDLGAQARALTRPAGTKPAGLFQRKPRVPPDLDACRAAVGHALESGELVLTRRHSANAPTATRDAIEADLREAAAHALFDALTRAGTAAPFAGALGVRRKASKTVSVSFDLHDTADLASAQPGDAAPAPSDP